MSSTTLTEPSCLLKVRSHVDSEGILDHATARFKLPGNEVLRASTERRPGQWRIEMHLKEPAQVFVATMTGDYLTKFKEARVLECVGEEVYVHFTEPVIKVKKGGQVVVKIRRGFTD